MNLLDFEVRKILGQGRSEVICAVQGGGHSLAYLQNALTYFNETFLSYWLTGPHDTGDVFKVMGSESRSRDISFSGSPSKTIYF